MCIKEFIGYSCGHCAVPVLRQCPLAAQNEHFPNCKFIAERPTFMPNMCHPCTRVVWNQMVLKKEEAHKRAHQAGICSCEVVFDEDERERRFGVRVDRFKSLGKRGNGGHGNVGHGSSIDSNVGRRPAIAVGNPEDNPHRELIPVDRENEVLSPESMSVTMQTDAGYQEMSTYSIRPHEPQPQHVEPVYHFQGYHFNDQVPLRYLHERAEQERAAMAQPIYHYPQPMAAAYPVEGHYQHPYPYQSHYPGAAYGNVGTGPMPMPMMDPYAAQPGPMDYAGHHTHPESTMGPIEVVSMSSNASESAATAEATTPIQGPLIVSSDMWMAERPRTAPR